MDICFGHDPRNGHICEKGSDCSKDHLDTTCEGHAKRFDAARASWDKKLAMRKASKDAKKICFAHDSRVPCCCPDLPKCQKLHLDTMVSAEANKFDAADAVRIRQPGDRDESRIRSGAMPAHVDMLDEPLRKAIMDSPALPHPQLVHAHEIPCYHDLKWFERSARTHMISIGNFVAYSSLWFCTPRLRLYRSMKPRDMLIYGEALGKLIGATLTDMRRSAVISLEKPLIAGFTRGMLQTNRAPFVLLALNGGDAPMTQELQEQVAKVPGFKACYAMNLHTPKVGPFFPLPIGLPHHSDGTSRFKLHGGAAAESTIRRLRAAAKPWHERDMRMLVTPMQATRLRTQYLEVLSQEAYANLVYIVSETIQFEDFLRLLSQHRSTLSPPGKGFDCFRTWQALALGTVPLVVAQSPFDPRLYADNGLVCVPEPHDLTPEKLSILLDHLCDPSKFTNRLDISYWTSAWNLHLGDELAH